MKNMKIENLFLLMSLFFGLLLVLIVPPFQSPDEDSHFVKSYMFAIGKVTPSYHNGNYGYYISENMNNYINKKQDMMGQRDIKYSYSDMYYDQLLSASYSKKTFRGLSTATASFFSYVVPAVGIKVALSLNAFDYSKTPNSKYVSTPVLLQFARIFSLVVYSLIGYCAIKITPKLKKTFFTILLLPTSLFLRSMVTYDGLLLAFITLAVASMFRLYFDSKHRFSKVDFLIFVSAGYFALNIKMVYSIVFFLMLFIPKEKFGTLKSKIKVYSLMIGIVLFLTLLMKICYYGVSLETSSIVTSQYDWALSNPLDFLWIIVDNINSQLSTQLYWAVGTVGLLDTYLPVLMVFLIYFNLIVCFFIETCNEKISFPWYINLIYAILIFISLIGIYSFMYLNWTPLMLRIVGGTEVTGVQGRYFLPYLLIIPFVLCNKIVLWIGNKSKTVFSKMSKALDNCYWLIPVVSLSITIFVVVIRYY